MTNIFDLIFGVIFWIAFLVPVGIFVFSMGRRVWDRFAPRFFDEGGITPDKALANLIFGAGQKGGVRRIDGTSEARATWGLRLGTTAPVALLYFSMIQSDFDMMRSNPFYTGMFSLFFVYALIYIWTFSIRWDAETLETRDCFFRKRRMKLADLDQLSLTQNGTFKLWFDDGSKLEVLKFITQSTKFHADMRAAIARKVMQDAPVRTTFHNPKVGPRARMI